MVVEVHARKEMEITPEAALDLEESGAFACVDDEIIAIGGIYKHMPGIGLAWTVLTPGWRRHARLITGLCEYGVKTCGLRRVEAMVKCGFTRGGAWLDRMGFVLEAPRCRKWGQDGEDYEMWARVDNG